MAHDGWRRSTWSPIDDWLGNLAVCSLALVPGTPPTIYAGTGEGFFNGDALAGEGIFKSVDGGVTFTQLAATASFTHVNRIAVHPTNPAILLAAVRNAGIYRSTNAGVSWSLVRSVSNSLQVAFDPNDGNRCVGDVYDGSLHRVVYSTNAGASWTNAATGLIGQSGISGRIELAYARSTANMVYASCGTGGGLIWRSTDGGVNWTQRTASGGGSGAAWYYNALWVDPFDANFLVTGAYHCYKSTNGGSTLTRISNGYINDNGPHPDVHGFVADPGYNGTTNNKVWVVTDGGVYLTNNVKTASTTSGWTRRDNRYRASQFYGAAGHGATGRINGGTQDNGSLTLQNNATSAQLTYGGDGGYAAIDWVNPNYIYGEYVYAEMHRSTNGGSSASTIDAGIGDSGSGSTANFIAPFILDPNDPARLLVGGASLWRTSNARAGTVAWSAIKGAVGANISAIAVAPGNANVIWVGHNDGRVYQTANGLAAAPTWSAVDANGAPNPLPNRFVERIVIDPANANRVWVALGGFSPDNLWLTTNGGTSFVDRTGSGVTGLPNAPIHGLCLHPVLAGRVYAGTEVGMFASEDDGLSWSTANEGPADTSVEEVVFMHGTTRLLVATHGRGLWTIDVREPTVTTLGAGCSGTAGVPALTATPPAIGTTVTATITSIPANAFCFLIVGFDITSWNGNPLPMALDPLGMTGCVGRVRPDLTIGQLAVGGQFATSFALPAAPNTVGSAFWAQGLVVDAGANPGGATVSNALVLTIGH
ncbi:MAG: hypothetical protein IPK26_14880 [Planctomycetes bacterium]|nr:hypothetical protein [Planctomycetota bacterium]